MDTVNNTVNVNTHATTSTSKGYYNPYIADSKTKEVPLVLPKAKVKVYKKKIATLRSIIVALGLSLAVAIGLVIHLQSVTTDYFNKGMILSNTAVVKTTMELIDVTDGTLTFKSANGVYVTNVPLESAETLVVGDTYGVCYNNEGLIYIGAFDR